MPLAIWGIGFAGVIAACRPASFHEPLSADGPTYLYIGQIILHGGTPYVDAADNKGPALYPIFAVIRALTGTSALGVRLTLLLFAALACVALAGYVDRHAGRLAGVLAGFSLALFSGAASMEGDDPNTEQYGIALLLGALYLAGRRGRTASVATGLILATALLINPAWTVVVPVIACEWWRGHGGCRRTGAMETLVGLAVVPLAIVVWIGAAGGLHDMWYQVFAQGSQYKPSVLLHKIVHGDYGALGDVRGTGLWELGLLGNAIALTSPRLRVAALSFLAWTGLVWVRLEIATYTFPHHHYIALPALAGGFALGLARLWSLPGRPVAITAVAVLLVLAWRPFHDEVVQPQRQRLALPASARLGRDYQLVLPMARFIDAHTRRSDPIFVVGPQGPWFAGAGAPGVFWLTGRPSPTRYFNEPAKRWQPPGYAQERQRDLLADPPVALGAMPGAVVDPTLRRLLRTHPYRLAYKASGMRIWLRHGQPG